MTRPALAAKAREIAFDTWPRDKRDRANLEKLQAAILSALIDADAAATERAAKVAESRAAKWTERIAEAVAQGYVPHYWRYFVTEADNLAAAIRSQEPTDADA